MTLILN